MLKDLIHRYIVGAQIFWTVDDHDLREILVKTLHHWFGVGIYNHSANLRDNQEGLDDVMEKRFTRQRAVILAWHALAVVAHRDKGGNEVHKFLNNKLIFREAPAILSDKCFDSLFESLLRIPILSDRQVLIITPDLQPQSNGN